MEMYLTVQTKKYIQFDTLQNKQNSTKPLVTQSGLG